MIRSSISARMRRDEFNWQLLWTVSTISVSAGVWAGGTLSGKQKPGRVRHLEVGEVHEDGDIKQETGLPGLRCRRVRDGGMSCVRGSLEPSPPNPRVSGCAEASYGWTVNMPFAIKLDAAMARRTGCGRSGMAPIQGSHLSVQRLLISRLSRPRNSVPAAALPSLTQPFLLHHPRITYRSGFWRALPPSAVPGLVDHAHWGVGCVLPIPRPRTSTRGTCCSELREALRTISKAMVTAQKYPR